MTKAGDDENVELESSGSGPGRFSQSPFSGFFAADQPCRGWKAFGGALYKFTLNLIGTRPGGCGEGTPMPLGEQRTWEFFFSLAQNFGLEPPPLSTLKTISPKISTGSAATLDTLRPPSVPETFRYHLYTQQPFATYNIAQMAANGDSRPAPGDRTVIGITFGNSNSSIAYTVDEKAEVIANEDGGEINRL